VNPQISGDAFDVFFAWAPWAIGAVIYFVFYVAKRHEGAGQATSIGQTYACAGCGRRGSRDQMLPQDHGGAVGWYCPHCASAQASPT
jgi:hypothetical protein